MIYEFKVIGKYHEPVHFTEVPIGTVLEFNLKISDYDRFVERFPMLERYIGTPPAVTFEGRTYGGGHGIETKQPEGFKEVLAKIGEHHPASPLADRYRKNKSIKEIKTKQAVEKSRKKTAKLAKEIAERRKRGGGVRAN
jgi:hypothetical protein